MNANKNIKVSIVILSLLRRKLTERCLRSISRYTTVPFEIIIVDMGGSKQIKKWLQTLNRGYENLKVIFNDANLGTSKGRNQGAAIARGEYLVFLDNDVEVRANWLAALIDVAQNMRSVGACGSKVINRKGYVIYSAMQVKSQQRKREKMRIGIDQTKVYPEDHPRVNRTKQVFWYPTTCLLVEKRAFNEVGGFDKNIFCAEEDKDLSLAMRKIGHRIFYVPFSCVVHDRGKGAKSYLDIRYNMKTITRDIRYFEGKRKCEVFAKYSQKYLMEVEEMSREQIKRKKLFDFFSTVID